MPINDSLEAYWSLEESSGTRADSKGSNNLADNNTVTSGTGKIGTAASFAAASNEFLSIADNASLSFGNEDMSIAGWAQFNSTGSFMDFLAKWNVAGSTSYVLRRTSGNTIQFIVSQDGTATSFIESATTISAATWYFIAARYDKAAARLRLRINATDETPVFFNFGIFDGTSDFLLGCIASAIDNLDGLLDEWGVWRRLLSTTDLDWLYNSGNGRSYADIVAESTPGGTLGYLKPNKLRPRIFSPGLAR